MDANAQRMRPLIRTATIAGVAVLALSGCTEFASPRLLPPPTVSATAPTGASFDGRVVDQALRAMVERQDVAGASALVFVDGKEVYFGHAGASDIESGRAWQRDTLAPIYSMTKPITGVTLMSLYQDGLFALSDPLAKYLPAYADLKVATGEERDGELVLEPPRAAVQIIDLLRYTACFGYGWSDHPSSEIMNRMAPLDSSKPLAQFSRELATIPLYCHPGTEWKYGVAVDVQARLVEVLTGQSFYDAVHERVLDPLGMTSTDYFVPADQRDRYAAAYGPDDQGQFRRVPDAELLGMTPDMPTQFNGGHGLISTVDDYMRFAEMLRLGGALDGVRVLRSDTVDLMTRDHLGPEVTERGFLPYKGELGFGFNLAVRTAPPDDPQEPYGVPGEFFWDGAASTLFWVDPKTQLSAVFLTQAMPFNGELHAEIRRAVYAALTRTANAEPVDQ